MIECNFYLDLITKRQRQPDSLFDATPNYGDRGGVTTYVTGGHSPRGRSPTSPTFQQETQTSFIHRRELANQHDTHIPSPIQQAETSLTRKRLFMDVDEQYPSKPQVIVDTPMPQAKKIKPESTQPRKHSSRRKHSKHSTPVRTQSINPRSTYKIDYESHFDLGEGWETKESRLMKLKMQRDNPRPIQESPRPIQETPIKAVEAPMHTPMRNIKRVQPVTPASRFKIPFGIPESERIKRKSIANTPLRHTLNDDEMDEQVLSALKSASRKIDTQPFENKKMMPYSSPAPDAFGKPIPESVEGTPIKAVNHATEKEFSFTFPPSSLKEVNYIIQINYL